MTESGLTTVTISEEDSGMIALSYPSSPSTCRSVLRNRDDLMSRIPQLRDHPLREGVVELPRFPFDEDPVLLTLEASQAAFLGKDAIVDNFTRIVFSLPAARAARWREAVSLALLGDWYGTLITAGNGFFGMTDLMGYLRREVRRVHLQLQPLWERKVSGHRVRLLDQPVTDGMLLRDLVTDGSGPDKTVLRTVLDDQRLVSVFALLSPAEQAVARAWAFGGALTWQEAAQRVGASDPAAFGERVRRKLRRRGREYLRRRPAGTASGLWLPPQA